MTNIKIRLNQLFRVHELKDFTKEYQDEIESIIFNTFGEDDLVIFSVPYIPQIGYDFDISSFLTDEEREESFFINTFRVKHITIQKDALVLDVYRV